MQTLANGPIFMGRVGEMHILTFTQAAHEPKKLLLAVRAILVRT